MADNDEHKIRAVDPEAVFRAQVAGRRVIYLDTGVWGELADDTPRSAACVERYAALVEQGRVVFPASWSSAFETLQHPHDVHRVRQLRAMDRLGRMVSFRQTLAVEREEALWAMTGVLGSEQPPPGRERVFTHVVEMVGDGFVVFPQGWNDRGITFIMEKLREQLRSYGLERIGSAMDLPRLRAWHATETETRMQERRGEAASRRNAAVFRRADGKLHRERILFEEQAYFLKRAAECMVGVMTGLVTPQQLAAHLERLKRERGGPLGLDRLFQLMPSTGLRAEVFARRVYEAERRERAGDLYDNEHASVPPAYSDAFVSGDRNLVRLLRGCETPTARGCRVLLGLTELDDYLEA